MFERLVCVVTLSKPCYSPPCFLDRFAIGNYKSAAATRFLRAKNIQIAEFYSYASSLLLPLNRVRFRAGMCPEQL
jgi:hypothetical protein